MTTRLLTLAAALALAAGCAKKPPPIVEVTGRVTLGGKPLAKAEVRFYPMIEFGGEYIAVGETDEDGRFNLVTTLGKPGACACENRVTVTEGSVPEDTRGMSAESQARLVKYQKTLKNRPIPPQYANLAQSPLKAQVTADRKEYDFDLSR